MAGDHGGAAPSQEELASLAGFTVSFFRSNDELWANFQKALKEDWAPDRLLAALRNTKWFKRTNQTTREAVLLHRSDPSEYQRRLRESLSRVQSIATAAGIPLGARTAQQMAVQAMNMGLNDDQIRRQLGSYGSVFDGAKKRGSLGGIAGKAQQTIDAALAAYGVQVTANSRAAWISQIAGGTNTEEFAINEIRRLAKSQFPGLAERIDAGETVMDIAAPYIEAQGRILEMNPKDVTLKDPKIRQALSTKDKDGKVSAKTLWQFEEDLRKDPRWNQTNNARESMMTAGREILSVMGLV